MSLKVMAPYLYVPLWEIQKYGLGLAMPIVTEWVGLGLGNESTLF